MIELTPLARPYAKALFDSAVESKNIDEMAEELKIMAAASKTDGVINKSSKSWVALWNSGKGLFWERKKHWL